MTCRSQVKGQRSKVRIGGISTFALCLLTFDLLGCAKPSASAFVANPPSLTAVQQLQQDVTTATSGPGVRRASWGIVVESLDRDERLFELNPRSLMVPASVAKIVSLATAVDAVGWDYRFDTTLQATGPIVNGVVQGDLIVVGSGDPAFGGRGGDDLAVWITALKLLGVTAIEGRIIGDDDAFEDPRPGLAWAWDDLGYTFGSLYGALNFAENRMRVTVIPGANEGEPPVLALQPAMSSREVINRVITGPRRSTQLIWPEQRPGESAVTIAGSIPAGGSSAALNVSTGNPTTWVASVLRQRLLDEGIGVRGDAADVDDVGPLEHPATVIYSYRSHPLAEIARPMLKERINLYGEAVFRLNAATAPRTNDAAIEGMQRRLEAWGINRDALQLIDGSGLSRRDVVAPETLVTVLRRFYDRSDTSPWMTAMPIAGRDGTLAARMKGTAAENNVRAKTGTMSNVRSLAGYVRTRDGERLAFAIMVNNFEGSGDEAVTAMDTIAVRLASFSRN
jgi:D-alanyl-D-alanine carboxypeptidase/D-alanyl-D-alanine-endopeptidase (penicillin-binding protein 4)